MPPVLLILVSVLLSVTAQTFLKRGTRNTGPIHLGLRGGSWLAMLFEKHIWTWFLLNVLALTLYLTALSKVDLNYAYPFIALSYALVPMVSIYLFAERVRPHQWLGIAVICLGVFLIAIN